MDRLSPTQNAEPVLPPSSGGGALRGGLYALLVAAGGFVRFGSGLATVSPVLAAPALRAADGAATGAPVRDLLELSLLPRAAEAAALAGLGLPTEQQAQLGTALKRDQLRLVQLPLFDAGPVSADGGDAGRVVRVSAAGFSRLVRLGRQPVVVTLPINRVGEVSFSDAGHGAQPLDVGAITITGPTTLPSLGRGDVLRVEVAAE